MSMQVQKVLKDVNQGGTVMMIRSPPFPDLPFLEWEPFLLSSNPTAPSSLPADTRVCNDRGIQGQAGEGGGQNKVNTASAKEDRAGRRRRRGSWIQVLVVALVSTAGIVKETKDDEQFHPSVLFGSVCMRGNGKKRTGCLYSLFLLFSFGLGSCEQTPVPCPSPLIRVQLRSFRVNFTGKQADRAPIVYIAIRCNRFHIQNRTPRGS